MVRTVRTTLDDGFSVVVLIDRASFAAAGWSPEDAGCEVEPADDVYLDRRIYAEGACSVHPPAGTVVERPEAESPGEARRMPRWTRYVLPCGRVMRWEPRVGLRAEG